MTMTALTIQSQNALPGRPTSFVVKVSNSSGDQVNVYTIKPTVPAGYPANIGPVSATPNISSANTGPYQFNVPVSAAGSAYFTFQATFHGQLIAGAPALPQPVFPLTVRCFSSDGSSFEAPPLLVSLSNPLPGGLVGLPPDAAAEIASYKFANPGNSMYLATL